MSSFVELRSEDTWLMLNSAFERAVDELRLREPEILRGALEDPTRIGGVLASEGRSPTAIVPLPDQPERLHLKRVLHGGALADLWRGHIAGLRRPRTELLTTGKLYELGAGVPRPVLAIARRRGALWQASLATVHQEGALDGLAFLATRPSHQEVLAAAAAAGGAVRRFHDLGGQHRDLHIKNLLFRTGGCSGAAASMRSPTEVEVLVIDLDGARAHGAPSPARRMHELARLEHSLAKRGLLDADGAQVESAFFRAYHADDARLRAALLSTR